MKNPAPKLPSPPAKEGFAQAAAAPSPLSLTEAAQRTQEPPLPDLQLPISELTEDQEPRSSDLL